MLTMVFTAACSQEEDALAAISTGILSTALADREERDVGLVNRRYVETTAENDYNVYGIYLKFYPTYDEEGALLTRECFDQLVVPRDRSWNPTLNCDVRYSETVLPDLAEVNDLAPMTGTIRVRGNSSRGNPMKNYKVKLENGRIFGYDSLNINKHFVDETRGLNKFCMDIMKLPPVDFISMETKFIHLYISERLPDGRETAYEDQGIYTFVEQPNRDYLKQHGLDPHGSIYKAMAFEFLPYREELLSPEDPNYDPTVYQEVIKPTANGKHEGLREMLDAVNNYSLNFSDVMEKYFDEENYLTWMAFNILLGNIDTLAHNFLMYSPSDSDKWYFMPWDFDGAVNDYGVTDMGINPYQSFGIHFYWSVSLHRRYFLIEGNIDKLNEKIREVRQVYLTEENIKYAQDQTIEVVLPFVADLEHHENEKLAALYRKNVNHPQMIREEIGKWNQSIQNNFDRYFLNLDNPTSGNVSAPSYEGGEWVFRWEASYDFQNEPITYEFKVATDAEFEHLIAYEENLTTPIFTMSDLPKGLIYFQYVAKDSSGHTQYPLNRLSIKDLEGNTLVRKRGVGLFDNESGQRYIIENEIFGDDFAQTAEMMP